MLYILKLFLYVFERCYILINIFLNMHIKQIQKNVIHIQDELPNTYNLQLTFKKCCYMFMKAFPWEKYLQIYKDIIHIHVRYTYFLKKNSFPKRNFKKFEKKYFGFIIFPNF